jgi:hypothetical protein
MDQLSIGDEEFERKVKKREKALFRKNKKERIERICPRLLSIPWCEICDSCFKRSKIFLKVLLFVVCISAGVFLFCKVSPFFSSIYGFFPCL